MEGFEHYVETAFGPLGPLGSNKVKEGLEKLRFLRSTPEDLKSKVDALPNVVDTNFNDPKVSKKQSSLFFMKLTVQLCVSAFPFLYL
jgi:hypothetical protein